MRTRSTGAATPWVQVPHSEAWYGADRCTENEEGEMEAGPPQRMVGHPDNPAGPAQLAIDAINTLMTAEPGLPARRVRHRGPVRPRRRRQPLRARRVRRPRGPRPRRRGQVRRRRHRGRVRHLGALEHRRRRGRHPEHRPAAGELHRAARGLRRGRVLPRVRPRPRAPGPLRHERRRRLAHRVLGPHELGLPQRSRLPVDAHPHGPLGQVRARLGQPPRLRPRRGRSGRAVGQTSRTPWAPRTASA